MYIPLHWHSTFSFLEAVSSPGNIVKKAQELWLPAIAITDYTGLYGLPSFTQATKAADIKAILWVELGFVLDLNATLLGKSIGNIVLLAETQEGYQNLMKLTSFANQDGISGKPKIDLKALQQWSKGIVTITWGTESWLWVMLNAGEQKERIFEIYEMIHKISGENCYLEVVAQSEQEIFHLREINQLCLSFAEKTGTKCLINNIYSYPNPTDKPTRELALAIKDNKKIYDSDRRKPVGAYHIMTEEEIRKIWLDNGYSEEQLNERLTNNELLAERVSAQIPFSSGLFPKYAAPAEIDQLYEQHKTELIIEGETSA